MRRKIGEELSSIEVAEQPSAQQSPIAVVAATPVQRQRPRSAPLTKAKSFMSSGSLLDAQRREQELKEFRLRRPDELGCLHALLHKREGEITDLKRDWEADSASLRTLLQERSDQLLKMNQERKEESEALKAVLHWQETELKDLRTSPNAEVDEARAILQQRDSELEEMRALCKEWARGGGHATGQRSTSSSGRRDEEFMELRRKVAEELSHARAMVQQRDAELSERERKHELELRDLRALLEQKGEELRESQRKHAAELDELRIVMQQREAQITQLQDKAGCDLNASHELLQRCQAELAERQLKHTAELREASDLLQRKTSDLLESQKKLDDELCDVREVARHWESQLVQLQDEHKEAVSEARAELCRREAESAVVGVKHQEDVGALRIALRQKELEIAELNARRQEELVRLSSSNTERQAEFLEVKNEHEEKEKEIEKLRTTCAELDQSCISWRRREADLASSLAKQQEQLNQFSATDIGREAEIADWRKKCHEKDIEIQELRWKSQEELRAAGLLMHQRSEAFEEQIGQVLAELGELQRQQAEELSKATTALQEREDELAEVKTTLGREFQDREAEVKEVERRAAAQVAELRASMLQQGQEETEQVKRDRDVAMEEVRSLLRQSQDELTQERARHRHEMIVLQDGFRKQESEFSEMKESHAATVDELRTLAQSQSPLAPDSKTEGRVAQAFALLKTKEEELAKLRTATSLQQAVHAKPMQEELAKLQKELDAARQDLRWHQDELGQLQSQLQNPAPAEAGIVQAVADSEELASLRAQLHEKTYALRRVEAETDCRVEDCAEFVRRLATSSSSPALEGAFDLETAEVLGMGNYGFVLTSTSRSTGERVVLKLMSDRWASVAMQEWSHGSNMENHPHIVRHIDAVMHRDARYEIRTLLQAAFETGALTGQEPKWFPRTYFCIALEHMDRGTAECLSQRGLLTLSGAGAIARQVASALAFMHKKKRAHNDIKPVNILLREGSNGDCLVAKLADMGLAHYSSDRTRDAELFGYTVWCLVTGAQFERVPAAGPAREEAIAVLEWPPSRKPPAADYKELHRALAGVVRGMWSEQLAMTMVEVQRMPELQDLQVQIPETQEQIEQLQDSAKRAVVSRTNTLRTLTPVGGINALSSCGNADGGEPELHVGQ